MSKQTKMTSMKKVSKTQLTALSMAVMCCDRFPELYSIEYIESLKKDYEAKLKEYKSRRSAQRRRPPQNDARDNGYARSG